MELKELAKLRHAAQSGEARRIRQAAGISMAELAAECGVGESTVHRWETGGTKPKGAHAARYAQLLAELAEVIPGA